MDLAKTRMRQLKKLVEQYTNQSQLADALGIQQNYISRLLSGRAAKEGGRQMGEKWARSTEEKLNLPDRYFDRPEVNPDGSIDTAEGPQLDSLTPEERREYDHVSKRILDLIVGRRHAVAEPEPDETGKWRLTKKTDKSKPRKRKRK